MRPLSARSLIESVGIARGADAGVAAAAAGTAPPEVEPPPRASRDSVELQPMTSAAAHAAAAMRDVAESMYGTVRGHGNARRNETGALRNAPARNTRRRPER